MGKLQSRARRRSGIITTMLHQYRFVVVIALLGLAAALATEKGKLPLALRGLKKTLRRDAGVQPTADARHAGVPVWKRLVALVLCVLAFAVAAAKSTGFGCHLTGLLVSE